MPSFWSLVVESGKCYKKIIESGVTITRVALDTSSATDKDEGFLQVLLDYEGKSMTVANLSIKHSILQTDLHLEFQCGEEIGFTTSGAKLPVTLTGIAGSDDDMSEPDLDDEYLDSLEEEEEEQVEVGKKRKIVTNGSASKASKMSDGSRKLTIKDQSFVSEDESDDNYNPVADLANDTADDALVDDSQLTVDYSEEESDEDESGEEEEESDDEIDLQDESLDEEEEEEDDEEESSEEEEESEMEVSPEKPKQQNGNFSKKQLKKLAQLSAAKEQQQSPKQPAGTPKQSKLEKLKAKEDKKTPSKEKQSGPKESNKATPAKKEQAKTPGKKEPKSPSVDKKQKAENKENMETPKQKKNKEGKKGSEQKTPKQMRSGGVMVEDVSVGSGTVAKNSSMVSVYYEGRLKNNNKLFDKKMSGPPFKFRLGRGEVIKGWDIGVQGMKVGGKRTIVIPPNMGYGKEGAYPDIPPNAHLKFDVTLINSH